MLQLRLGDSGLRRVLEAGTFPAVRRLDVSHQDLGPDSLRALIGRDSPLALEELRFAGNRLFVPTGDERDDYGPLPVGAGATLQALAAVHSESMRLLDLSGQLLAEGALELARSAHLPNLQILIVRDCGLKPATVRALRERFPCVLAGDAEDLTHVPAFFEVWP
jgi:hypothetical protein